jgi:hypothetical protein
MTKIEDTAVPEMVPYYVAGGSLMSELQTWPYVAGVLLPSACLSFAMGVFFGGLWVAAFGALGVFMLGLAVYATNRAMEARSLAAAHAFALRLRASLNQEGEGE